MFICLCLNSRYLKLFQNEFNKLLVGFKRASEPQRTLGLRLEYYKSPPISGPGPGPQRLRSPGVLRGFLRGSGSPRVLALVSWARLVRRCSNLRGLNRSRHRHGGKESSFHLGETTPRLPAAAPLPTPHCQPSPYLRHLARAGAPSQVSAHWQRAGGQPARSTAPAAHHNAPTAP